MFITFEGIDGCGKSTQAQMLVERLRQGSERVCLFREPGGTRLSERVRTILLDPHLDIHPLPELLLFSSARAQLVREAIRPELDQGAIVVCDRFFDSTTAYQGAGRRLADLEWMHAFNLRVTGGLIPDRTYYLAISPSAALKRRAERADLHDRMEGADAAFYRRVISAYEELAEAEPSRFVRLDGALSIDELHSAVWSDMQELRVLRGG